MRPSVRAAWSAFIQRWEGRLAHLYLDTKKLATFGLGNMVDTGSAMTDYGLTRPWRDTEGDLVTEGRIRDEYTLIHSREDLAPKGGRAYAAIATLHLDDAAVDEALWDTTERFWAVLLKSLPDLEQWPADAQLALLGLAWNVGPNFVGSSSWPNFTRSAKAADFAGCAVNCMRAVRAPRDFTHRALFWLAAGCAVSDDSGRPVGGDPAVLHI